MNLYNFLTMYAEKYSMFIRKHIKCLFILILLCVPAQGFALDKTDAEKYKHAFKQIDQNKWDNALYLAKTGPSEELNKVITWLHIKRRGAPASFATISNFMDTNPDWPHQYTMSEQAEARMPNDWAPQQIIAWFEKYAPRSLPGYMTYTQALLDTGQEKKAKEIIRNTWISQTFSSKDEKYFLARYKKYLSNEDMVSRMDRLLWDRHSNSASRIKNKVPMGYRYLANARISLFRQKPDVDYAVNQVPKDMKEDPGLSFDRLQWRRKKGKNDAAREILLNPPEELVRPNMWWKERAIQVREAIKKGEHGVAYQLASQHGQLQGADYAEAEYLSGWIALEYLLEPKKALGHFNNFNLAVSTPVSKSRGFYWTARAYQALNDNTNANLYFKKSSNFTTTFYGQLASNESAHDMEFNFDEKLAISSWDRKNFENSELTRVVRALGEIGQENKIDPFIQRLLTQKDNTTQQALVAELAMEQKRHDLTVLISRRTRQDGLSMMALAYPTITTKKNLIEPALMHAIIRQESSFDKKATSPAGARGLMQLMPGTARQMSGRLRLHYSRDNLFNPDYNTQLGSGYLSQLLNKYDGNYILAIAAYNAGPGRVNSWIRELGDPREKDMDQLNWMESIPISETRNYVQRVIENLMVYRNQMGEQKIIHPVARLNQSNGG